MTPFFMSKPVLYKTDFYNTGYELISKLSDFGIQLSTNCRCSSHHLRAISSSSIRASFIAVIKELSSSVVNLILAKNSAANGSFLLKPFQAMACISSRSPYTFFRIIQEFQVKLIEHPMRCPTCNDNPFSPIHRFFQRCQHG